MYSTIFFRKSLILLNKKDYPAKQKKQLVYSEDEVKMRISALRNFHKLSKCMITRTAEENQNQIWSKELWSNFEYESEPPRGQSRKQQRNLINTKHQWSRIRGQRSKITTSFGALWAWGAAVAVNCFVSWQLAARNYIRSFMYRRDIHDNYRTRTDPPSPVTKLFPYVVVKPRIECEIRAKWPLHFAHCLGRSNQSTIM